MPENNDDDKLNTSTRLALCSAVGAALVLLANVYGSGSYLEPFPETVAKIIKAFVFTISGLFATYFAVEIASFLEHHFGIKKTSPIKYRFLNITFKFSFIVLVASSIFLVSLYISDNISPGLDRSNTQIALLISSAISVIFFSTTVLLYIAVEFLQNQRIVYSISIFVLMGFYLILFNLARDAEKAAFVTDAEFCYWKLASNETPPASVCAKFNGSFSSYSVEVIQPMPKRNSQGN